MRLLDATAGFGPYRTRVCRSAVLFARISDDARHDILQRNAEALLGHHLDSD